MKKTSKLKRKPSAKAAAVVTEKEPVAIWKFQVGDRVRIVAMNKVGKVLRRFYGDEQNETYRGASYHVQAEGGNNITATMENEMELWQAPPDRQEVVESAQRIFDGLVPTAQLSRHDCKAFAEEMHRIVDERLAQVKA